MIHHNNGDVKHAVQKVKSMGKRATFMEYKVKHRILCRMSLPENYLIMQKMDWIGVTSSFFIISSMPSSLLITLSNRPPQSTTESVRLWASSHLSSSTTGTISLRAAVATTHHHMASIYLLSNVSIRHSATQYSLAKEAASNYSFYSRLTRFTDIRILVIYNTHYSKCNYRLTNILEKYCQLQCFCEHII